MTENGYSEKKLLLTAKPERWLLISEIMDITAVLTAGTCRNNEKKYSTAIDEDIAI